MLSIDQGLLPPAYASEFSKAQYSAPPLSYPLVCRTFQRELGRGPLEVFDEFEPKAAHGASIGQVHRARKDGQDFAVKVQYPGVADSIKSDLAVVKPIALQIMGVRERDVRGYFEEIETRLLEETDYELELERAVRVGGDCAGLANLRFPRYFPELSSRRILTMEWVEGEALDRFADREESQERRDRIGQVLWDFYDFQIHKLRLFHADPHPGNFLVQGEDLVALDFGCTKEIDDEFYRKNFLFLREEVLRDRGRLVAAMEDLDILLPGDSAVQREEFLKIFVPTVELLARPFHGETFDFGDPAFMKAIVETGEANRKSPVMRGMKGERGSRHAVYVNRAYFGLYSLMSRLRARVRVRGLD